MFRLKSFAPRCHGIFQSLVPHVWKGQASIRPVSSGQPDWWNRGWPRERVGSMAEAELLSQLALLLRPRVPIAEMFRRFPAPEGWGGQYLDPDLAVYGVLRKKDAALFVEYDGYWRHGEEESMLRDQRKSATLLANAPSGSWVVRLSHTRSGSDGNVVWISFSPWRQGDQKALGQVLQGSLRVLLTELKGCFRPEVEKRLQMQAVKDILKMPPAARKFCDAAACAVGGSTQAEINDFLRCNGFCNASIKQFERKVVTSSLSIQWRLEAYMAWLCEIGLAESQASKAVSRFPNLLNCSIEQNLKPKVKWLSELGLRKAQVAKVVTTAPQILGYSLEQNLKPTVEWLSELGLSKDQVAKAVTTAPQILGYSIEQNLKPTVEWLSELGLSEDQVAKVVTTAPQILGCSLEQNLKPTVEWLSELGLSEDQVAKVVTTAPQILGCSLEQNLKPTVEWLSELGLSEDQVAKVVSAFPPVFSCGIEQNLKPTVHWLLDLGLSRSEVANALVVKPQILGYSLALNLTPKVRWLQDWGLKRDQISRQITMFPLILGLSITNLKSKVKLLNDVLTKEQVVDLIARSPWILGYSAERFQNRLEILARQQKDREDALVGD